MSYMKISDGIEGQMGDQWEALKAVVTGASSGIGQATAQLLGEKSVAVVVHYNRNRKGAETTVAAIVAKGGRAVAIQADLSSAEGVDLFAAAVHKDFGEIDILINNAGSMVARSFLSEASENLFHRVMDVNVTSVFLVTKAFIGDMVKKKKGSIVNMGSVAGRNGGGPDSGIYAASKAAVISLTKSMAREFVADGIRVNAVNPGIILTPFHDEYTAPELLNSFIESVPLKRGAQPSEVAEVIVFLASDKASYLTGESVEINGGWLMS
jgi:3-oxoacyl-[acyl-carrier protein] reductase